MAINSSRLAVDKSLTYSYSAFSRKILMKTELLPVTVQKR
jgi:hypothetical protein